MNLSEAFKMAVQKYYEGYDYKESKNMGLKGKEFEYDWDKLDSLHQEIRKPKKRAYNRRLPQVDAMEDIPVDDYEEPDMEDEFLLEDEDL